MKLRIKILFIIIVVTVALFSAVHMFLVFKGGPLIVKQLESLTRKKASIGSFHLIFPLNLEIRNLDIQGLAKIDYIFISPSILRLLTGQFALNEVRITRPEFTFEKVLPPITEVPLVTESAAASTPASLPVPSTSPAAAALSPTKPRHLNLIFKRITIKEGKIDFIDRTVGEGGIKITVKDISFSLTNLYMPARSVATNFELKGKIPWQQESEEGKIQAEGWLNLFKKDMAASIKVEDIDGVYLYPYYAKWVDLEKARIESAKLNFTSNINGLNNNVTAECHLELTDIVRKPRPAEEQEKAEKIATAVLDIFRALNQGKIVLDFTIRTKMDRPEFGFGNIKMAFEDKLSQAGKADKFDATDILMLPAKLLEGTVKGATDVSKAVIDGTFAVGNELKKAVEGSFKKEKQEEKKE